MINYFDFIKGISDSQFERFYKMGFAKAGNNGPYNNDESPIRNTAHWLITYSYLWKQTSDKKYIELVNKFFCYLIRDEHYGRNGAIICRYDKNIDKTNGVIGQAWAIEALVEAYKVLKDKISIEIARKIFFSQKYNYESHVWEVIDADGKNWGFDRTYNHQLWFAASGSLLLDIQYDAKIESEILDFLDHSNKLFYIHKNGLLYHQANCRKGIFNNLKFFLRKILCELSHKLKLKSISFNILMLEEGYHLFDLYGFALLSNRFGNHKIFNSSKLKKAIKYGASGSHIKSLLSPCEIDKRSDFRCNDFEFNEYAFGYNSPAFEYPFIAVKLKQNYDENTMETLWNTQIALTFNSDKHMFSEGNNDPNTLTARIYELVRYLDNNK